MADTNTFDRTYNGQKLIYGREMSDEECFEYLHFPEGGREEKRFAALHGPLIPYYRSWTHERPLLLSHDRDEELRRLSDILYRSCCMYVRNYTQYLNRIPLEDKVLRLLEYVHERPFAAGTWRPDYLILDDGSLKLCEITSRFFGNGYFLSYFTEHAARVFAQSSGVTDRVSRFEEMLEYFADMMRGKKKLLVLTSSDRSDSIRLYVPFYRDLGMETEVMHVSHLTADFRVGRDTAVVSAMNQRDLLALPENLIRHLVDSGMRNDLRSVFLLHDKRLFALLGDPAFTGTFLEEEEGDFLRKHIVQTYLPGEHAQVWEDAREHKDGYILKHRALGKSESVYAGSLTRQDDWEKLFADGSVKEMILQPFCSQRIFENPCGDQVYREYICGTILTVDDRYFGTGLFRTSTRAVINQADAHKAAPLVTDESFRFPGANRL